MSDQVNISRIERQARSADHRDGLMEIFAAAVFFVFSLTWLVGPEFVGIAAVAVIFFFPKLLALGKERITYRRIGYSADVPASSDRSGRGMLVFISGAVTLMIGAVWIFGDLNDPSDWRRAAPLLPGLAFAGGLWFSAQKSGLLRHRFLSVSSVAIGVTTWVLSDGRNYDPVGFYLLGMGCLSLLIGVAAFVGFARRNPISENDEPA